MTSTYIDSGIATADRFLPRLFVADEVRSATVTATSGTPAPVKNLTTYSAWTPSAFPATVTADFGSSKSFDYVAAYLKSASGNYEPYRDWETDRKSTRLNSSHEIPSRMPSSA